MGQPHHGRLAKRAKPHGCVRGMLRVEGVPEGARAGTGSSAGGLQSTCYDSMSLASFLYRQHSDAVSLHEAHHRRQLDVDGALCETVEIEGANSHRLRFCRRRWGVWGPKVGDGLWVRCAVIGGDSR